MTANQRPGYLPSLDGWRALAILGVLWVHETPLTFRGYNLEPWQRWGSLGVVLFFAISGVLISWRILEEEQLTGRFHLKLFYIRRLFRIQPAALAYLGTIAVLVLAGVLHESWSRWFSALLLYANFLYHPTGANEWRGFYTGHFWTLAVEEHFYLLISLALFFVRRRRLLVFGTLLLLIKAAQVFAMHHTPEPLLRRTYWQIHILLWPAFVAMLLRAPRVRSWVERWAHPWLVFVFTLAAGYVASLRSQGLLITVISYAFTLWVVATMLHPRSWTTRALEWKPLRFFGRLSYSIYLWHVLFYGPATTARSIVFLSSRPWKYIGALSFAVASYYLVEKPMIRLGHKLAPSATAGQKDLADLPTLPQAPHAAGN